MVPIVLEMHGIAAQHQPSGLGQMHEQRLMAWGVARRRNEHGAAVAEHVVIAIELHGRMFEREPRHSRRKENRIAVGRKRPIIFGLLDQQRRRGKHIDIADMVGMGMRHGDVTDVRRFDSDLVELRGERLRLAPHQRGAGSDLIALSKDTRR